MKTQKTIAAIGLLSIVGLSMILGNISAAMTPELVDGLYSILGLGIIGFNIFAAILLLKKEK